MCLAKLFSNELYMQMGPAKMMGEYWFIFPIIMMILFFVLFRFGMFGKGFRPGRFGGNEETQSKTEEESPMEILKRRYAKGEISTAEYENMKENLK